MFASGSLQFAAYLQKKRSEGKHYYVALSHAAKKLVRVLFHLETLEKSTDPRRFSLEPELKI
jgi:hypothetical protein